VEHVRSNDPMLRITDSDINAIYQRAVRPPATPISACAWPATSCRACCMRWVCAARQRDPEEFCNRRALLEPGGPERNFSVVDDGVELKLEAQREVPACVSKLKTRLPPWFCASCAWLARNNCIRCGWSCDGPCPRAAMPPTSTTSVAGAVWTGVALPLLRPGHHAGTPVRREQGAGPVQRPDRAAPPKNSIEMISSAGPGHIVRGSGRGKIQSSGT
jgi:hypothetical protein